MPTVTAENFDNTGSDLEYRFDILRASKSDHIKIY